MSKHLAAAAACGLLVSLTADSSAQSTPDRDTSQDDPQTTEATSTPERPHRAVVSYDRGLRLSVDDWFGLTLNGLLQARYTLNHRSEPPVDPDTMQAEKHVTQGFDVARARLTIGVGLTDFVALSMRFGVVAGGSFTFQQAFIDLKWKHFRLRGGVFSIPLIAESLVHPAHLMFADYSILANVFSPGSSKGVMMTYSRERFSLDVGYSDGLRTGFSEIRAPVNADYALTVRVQGAWGRLAVGAFNQLDARRGTPFGVRLGAGVHYQDGGRTQGSLPVRIALGSLDLALQANGGSLLLSGVVGQDATDGTATIESGEVVVGAVSLMGGYFVIEDLQLFGQYSLATKPRIEGSLPPDLDPLVGPPSPFHAIGVGASYFVLPNRNNVKVTTDFQYFIGRTRGSLVPASPLNSIQSNDAGNQLAWRVQVSGVF